MKRYLMIIFVFFLFLAACNVNNHLPQGTLIWNPSDVLRDPYEIGDTRVFWAQDLSRNNSFYRLNAVLLAKNNLCNVWVELQNGQTAPTIDQIMQADIMADAYLQIYEKIAHNETGFGANFTLENNKTYNTMQIADFMGDQDGKLCILLLDIKDGLEDTNTYVAGYFAKVNLYKDPYFLFARSNECDMIYLSTRYPEAAQGTYRVAAHELQHLMNFVTSVFKRNTPMDTWIDEGLSSAAEWVYAQSHNTAKINWYNNNEGNTIAQGNNFFVWDNHMDDYATVYIFFQWLRLQKDNTVYNKIMNSPYSDYRAVTSLFNNVPWSDFLEDWYKANYNNDYNGEFNLNRHYLHNSTNYVYLYPGEGVYSYSEIPLTDNAVPQNSGNIRYVGMENALLTLNANPSNTRAKEQGIITGERTSLQGARAQSRSMDFENTDSAGPVAISAGELLR